MRSVCGEKDSNTEELAQKRTVLEAKSTYRLTLGLQKLTVSNQGLTDRDRQEELAR